ncbi:unnamed protein product, partial [marine sediment metagenome]
VIKDYGFNRIELYIGDCELTSDTDAREFFAFKGKIFLYFNDYLPLDRDDYRIHPYEGPITFENNEILLEYSSEYFNYTQ